MNSPGGYIYILYGEDSFARDEQVLKLKERMREQAAGEHNLTELSGNEATVANLRLAADAVPFLADRRLVLVRGLLARLAGRGGRGRARAPKKQDTTADEAQALFDYLPRIPQTTSVVFIEEGRLEPRALEEAIPHGRAFVREFQRQDPASFVRQRAKLIEADIDEGAVRELAALGGNDLRRIDSELHKLAVHVAGRTITRVDVRELVVAHDIQVWALLDALAERRADRALKALRTLYAQGESPEALLGRDIAPHYRRLMVARELASATREERARVDVAALGLNPATVPKWTEQAARFQQGELERALEWLLDLDRKVKTGEAEPEVALELVIAQLCSRLASVV